jgi:hypothetical protein
MARPFRLLLTAVLAAFLMFLVGCAGPAPNYSPSIDNVEGFKKAGASPAKTGGIAVAPGLKTGTEIQLRANTMVSGVGRNYGDYIEAALKQELEMARLYDPRSELAISGTLLRNEVNAGGFSTADGAIEVRFVVRRGDQVRYDKTRTARHEWASSFVGAVAIPAAANSYPILVQKLIGALLADPDFLAALR